jgi:hypothetical protein
MQHAGPKLAGLLSILRVRFSPFAAENHPPHLQRPCSDTSRVNSEGQGALAEPLAQRSKLELGVLTLIVRAHRIHALTSAVLDHSELVS